MPDIFGLPAAPVAQAIGPGILGGITGLFSSLLDKGFAQVNKWEDLVRMELAGTQLRDALRGGAGAFGEDEEHYRSATGVPNFGYGNYKFSRPGNVGFIDTAEGLMSPWEQFQNATATPFDWSGNRRQSLESLASGTLAGMQTVGAERRDPGEVAKTVGGFLSDQPFIDSAREYAGEIGRGSKERLATGVRGAVNEAFGREGGGAESLRDKQKMLQWNESSNRQGQMTQAFGDLERRKADISKTRAGLQSGAYMGQQNLNASLAKAAGGMAYGAGTSGASLIGEYARAEDLSNRENTRLGMEAVRDENAVEAMKFARFLQLQGLSQGAIQNAIMLVMNREMPLFQARAGYTDPYYQPMSPSITSGWNTGLSAGMDSATQRSIASGAGGGGSSFGLTTAINPGNWFDGGGGGTEPNP